MKIYLITCIAMLGFASVSMSQSQLQGSGVLSPEGQSYLTDYNKGMAVDLGLDEEQRSRLHEQTSAHYLKQQSVHNNELDTDELDEFTRTDYQRYDNELRQIFNEEQYQRYQENLDNYRPDYQREQRATPTQEGIQTRPRHGE